MQGFFVAGSFILFLFFLLSPATVLTAAENALALWGKTLVPSLFPFILLNELMAASGGAAVVGKALRRPLRRLLGLPGAAGYVLATGYTAGVPVSAALIAGLYRRGSLPKGDAERLLPFAANVSPLFLLAAVAVGLLGDEKLGPALALSHYGSNAALTTVVCAFRRRGDGGGDVCPPPPRPLDATVFADAVSKAAGTMVLIGGVVVSFFILLAAVETVGVFPAVAAALGRPPAVADMAFALFSGVMEITAGAAALTALPLSRLTFALLTAVFAFGGLSAAAQIGAELRGTDLTLGFYFRYKIIQGVTSFVISLLLPYRILPLPAVTASSTLLVTGICVAGGLILLLFPCGAAGPRWKRSVCRWYSNESRRGSS